MRKYINPFTTELLDTNFKIETDLLHLYITQDNYRESCVSRKMGFVEIRMRNSVNLHEKKIQRVLANALVEELRIQAKTILPKRLANYSQEFNLKYNRIFIKNVVSRWGSCSEYGNINLSLWLMLAPSHLIDYVIKHELAHLNEMNHGPLFWNEVDKMTNQQGKHLEKEMKVFGHEKILFIRCVEARRKSSS